jgi:hypothetical protein
LARFREGDKVRYSASAFTRFGVAIRNSRAGKEIFTVDRVWRGSDGLVFLDLSVELPSGRRSSGISVREDLMELVHG